MTAIRTLVAGALACALLTGCVAPVGTVEVTRFHLSETARLGRGTIAAEPGPGMDAASIEYRTYAEAVSRQLVRVGYGESAAGTLPEQTAIISLRRQSVDPVRESPVSVGVGGQAGSWGSGVGLGVGIDLSGPPPATVETELAVTIRDRATGASLWEGRASFAVSAKSPLARAQLGAAKITEALFTGFPGVSGETIRVP